jgi:glycosyltransferase involved in cell wall biosynthesis
MNRPIIAFGMNTMFAVRQFLPETIRTMQNRGFHVIVIAPPGEVDPKLEGVEYRLVAIDREISPYRDLRALFQIWSILRKLRPSICNMSTPKMALLGGLAGWLARVPHRIYTLRGLRYETTRGRMRSLLIACEKLACGCAHQVICISRSVREGVIRDGVAPPAKTTVLGDRVSEGLSLKPESAPAATITRKDCGIPETSAVMGFVGRLTKDKGIRELVDAFCILRAEGKDVRLLLLGDFESGDPVDQATEQRIRSDPGIRWLGYVPDPHPYYPLMDVFVFPTYREGLGRVLLEAAAAGKPVVSTHTTGVVDVVFDGVTGLLVPTQDAAAVAQAVGTILRDRHLARAMGERARELVRQEFDNSVYLGRLAGMIEALVQPDPTKEVSR